MMSDPALSIAVPLIAANEGFRSKPYQDSAGTWTIGFGYTYLDRNAPVTADTPPMSLEEGERRLAPLVASYMQAVRNMVHVPVTNNQIAALTDFAYNEGTQRLRTSHLMLDLNTGRYQEAAARFGEWVYAGGKMLPGLVKRRAAEKALFLTPDNENPPICASSRGGAGVVKEQVSHRPTEVNADDLNAGELSRITTGA